MASSISKPPSLLNLHKHTLSSHHSPVTLSFPFRSTTSFNTRLSALRTGSDSGRGRIGSQEVLGPDLLRKPVVSQRKDIVGISEEEEEIERKRVYEDEEDEEDKWVDWEDKILEDTVPLVGFVRMLIHSGK